MITLLYVAGLLLGDAAARFPALFAGFIALLVMTALVTARKERERWVWLLALATMVAGTVWWNAHAAPAADDVSHLTRDARFAGHTVRLRGAVASEMEETERGRRFYVEAERVSVGGTSQRVSGMTLAHAGRSFAVAPGRAFEASAQLLEPTEAGNSGQTSRRQALARERVFSRAALAEDSTPRLLPSRPQFDVALWFVQLRRKMLERTRATMPQSYSDLVSRVLFSIVYGMQATPLPEALIEEFRVAGVIHVLVVSGSQVAFFFLLMRALATRVPRRSVAAWLAFALALASLVGYYLLCSAPPTRIPSLARATMMAALFGLGALLARDVDNITSLAAAALMLLIANPQHLHSASFQLSFMAVLGIVALTRPIAHALRLGASLPAQALAATLAAQLMTAPLLAHYFGRVSLIGLVANLFIVPLAAILIPLGCLGSLAALGIEPLAVAVNFLNYHATTCLMHLTHFFAGVPHASVPVSRWSVLDVSAFYGFVALGAVAATPSLRAQIRVEPLLVVAAMLLTAFVGAQYIESRPGLLEITALDVGDGDCLFIRSPTGTTMLIDGGTRQDPTSALDAGIGERVILPFLLTRKVGRLDVVVVTHPHDDHLSGLPAVLRRLPVGLVLDTGERVHTPNYDALLDLIRARKIPYRLARRGQRLDLGGGAVGFVLTPLVPKLSDTPSDLNNNSIAIKIQFRQFSALLAADLEQEAEARLVRRGDRLRATVLKAGHHGSKTSSTDEFLRAVRPRVTLISCGPSTFVHPAPETLDRLAASGTRVMRTDLHGAITVESEGTQYRINAFKDGERQPWQLLTK